MTDEYRGRGRRATIAERRERRAQIDDPVVVLEAAARFLEPRARSVVEVRRRLTGAGYRMDLVESSIERMVELGMLDDAAFARSWVESRDRARPRGERALRQELAQKGIDRAIVDGLFDQRRDASTARDAAGLVLSADQARAEHLLARHMRAISRVADPRQRRQRAYSLLARNGFDAETCRTVAVGLVSADVERGGRAEDDD